MSNVLTKISDEGIISGSSQVVLNGDQWIRRFDTSDVSEHSSNLYYTDDQSKN